MQPGKEVKDYPKCIKVNGQDVIVHSEQEHCQKLQAENAELSETVASQTAPETGTQPETPVAPAATETDPAVNPEATATETTPETVTPVDPASTTEAPQNEFEAKGALVKYAKERFDVELDGSLSLADLQAKVDELENEHSQQTGTESA